MRTISATPRTLIGYRGSITRRTGTSSNGYHKVHHSVLRPWLSFLHYSALVCMVRFHQVASTPRVTHILEALIPVEELQTASPIVFVTLQERSLTHDLYDEDDRPEIFAIFEREDQTKRVSIFHYNLLSFIICLQKKKTGWNKPTSACLKCWSPDQTCMVTMLSWLVLMATRSCGMIPLVP